MKTNTKQTNSNSTNNSQVEKIKGNEIIEKNKSARRKRNPKNAKVVKNAKDRTRNKTARISACPRCHSTNIDFLSSGEMICHDKHCLCFLSKEELK